MIDNDIINKTFYINHKVITKFKVIYLALR